jgi:hypothetical protein
MSQDPLNNSGRAFKSADDWILWYEKQASKGEEELGFEEVYEAGYYRGAVETQDLIIAKVEELCQKYPSVRFVQAIKDLREMLKRTSK